MRALCQAPPTHRKEEIEITWFAAMTTYLGYAVLVAFGHLRDFFGKLTGTSRYFSGDRKPRAGYAPLLKDWENFYTRRLYHRIQDCWNRPIVGPPTAKDMVVVDRTSADGNCTMRCVTMSSRHGRLCSTVGWPCAGWLGWCVCGVVFVCPAGRGGCVCSLSLPAACVGRCIAAYRHCTCCMQLVWCCLCHRAVTAVVQRP